MSVKKISEMTGISEHSVKTAIKNLEKSGSLQIERSNNKNGASVSNTYIIKDLVLKKENVNLTEKIKNIYISMCSSRENKQYTKYAFSGYMNVFSKISDICVELSLDPYIYIASCFHTFPENWCIKAFATKYPLPYALSSKKKAEERYNSFLRFVHQRTEEIYEDKGEEFEIANDMYFWDSIGRPTGYSTLSLLIENGSLSERFAFSVADESDLSKFSNEYHDFRHKMKTAVLPVDNNSE